MSWWKNNYAAQQFLNRYESKERGIVLFLGAGITAPYFPTWTELIKVMVGEVENKGKLTDEIIKVIHSGIERGALPEVASICKEELRERVFNQLLQNIFIKPIVETSRINDLKSLLSSEDSPVRAIITTNFDSLTSAIAPRHDLALTWNTPLSTLKRVKSSDERFLFHIHGMISDPENIILTSEDYAKLQNNSEAINLLTQLLSENIVLYLGFSIQDRDFISIIDQIRFLYGGGWQDHFVVYPSPISGPESTLQTFHYIKFLCYVRDITFIEYDPSDNHKALDEFIHHLANFWKPKDDIVYKYIEKIASLEIIPKSRWPEEYKVQPSDFKDIYFQQINGKEAVRGSTYNITFIKDGLLRKTLKTILITGEAGVGKTTLCQWLSKEFASSHNHNGSQGYPCLPIHVSLREICPSNLDELYNAKVPILELSFKELSEICSKKHIGLLLLLDGLNEIGISQREALVTTIHGFRKATDFDISLMFTSRSVGVTEALLSLLGQDVSIYEIQRWTEDQLSKYLEKNNVDKQKLSLLSKEMRISLRLPLFAWLYIQINREGSVRPFYTIGDIFNTFINTRLEPIPGESEEAQEIRDKFKYDFPITDKKKAIAKLAFLMTQENTVTVECNKLESCIENAQNIFKPMALELINSGILRCVGKAALDPEVNLEPLRKTTVMFLHQALQEYLTAAYIGETSVNREKLPGDPSMNAFWRDVPIYMMRLLNNNTEDGRKASRELFNSFLNPAKPDFWTAARLIDEMNPADQSDASKKVTDELISVLSKDTSYAHAIQAFAELREYSRKRLLNEIQNSKQIEIVLAMPESHLYDQDKLNRANEISDRESVWRSLGRPIYMLGELGEPRLIEVLLPKIDKITSVHLIYHIAEAFLSIIRLEPGKNDLYSRIIDRFQNLDWLNHNDPVVAAYSAAIIREINPSKKLNIENIVKRLINFLHDKTLLESEYFEDEFWQRAHGIDVLPEIADANDALELMLKLLLQENTSTYSEGKVKGYQLIHSAILKGAIRLQKRLQQIDFSLMRELIEAAISSERIGGHNWACGHLENLLLLICTTDQSQWLKGWISKPDIPEGTRRVLRNVSHALISN